MPTCRCEMCCNNWFGAMQKCVNLVDDLEEFNAKRMFTYKHRCWYGRERASERYIAPIHQKNPAFETREFQVSCSALKLCLGRCLSGKPAKSMHRNTEDWLEWSTGGTRIWVLNLYRLSDSPCCTNSPYYDSFSRPVLLIKTSVVTYVFQLIFWNEISKTSIRQKVG